MASVTTADKAERITLTIPASLKRRVEAAVPDRQRSAFAAAALEEALQAKARAEALAMLDDLPTAQGDDLTDTLRTLRDGFDGR